MSELSYRCSTVICATGTEQLEPGNIRAEGAAFHGREATEGAVSPGS